MPSLVMPPYRWIAMGIVLFGTFMVVLDTTIVNLGLPAIQEDLAVTADVEWIVTGYLVAVGVAQLASGWLAESFGRRRSFIAALVVFTAGSILCALAPTLVALVAARLVQGIGGGLMMPVAMAMVYELFPPEERGRAIGIFGIGVMVAPAVGPVLGGSVVAAVGWRWLFLINIPVGILGVIAAAAFLRESGSPRRRPLDRRGLLAAGTGVVALLIALQKAGDWGWASAPVAALVLLSGGLLAAFIHHARVSTDPLVDVRVLFTPVFSLAMAAGAMLTIAQYSRLVFIPLELGTTRDISAIAIGLTMLPSAIGVAATMPLGGHLADRLGARLPYAIGIVALAASFWPLAHLTPTTSLETIAAVLFVGGLGAGLAMMAPTIVAMNSVSATHVAQASGLNSVTRQLAAAFGTAVLASVLTAASDGPGSASAPVPAYNTLFLVVFVLLLFALALAAFLPGRHAALALQRDRRRELDLAAPDTRPRPLEL